MRQHPAGWAVGTAARGGHENRIGAADRDWRDWHAAYMVAEQAGTELPRWPIIT